MIVSLTTYPDRIGMVSQVLDSLKDQTRPADRIVLWLAQSQFPRKEEDIPPTLRQQAVEGVVEIRWCRDLMMHTKYFYAIQEFPEDVVVTLNDDILYPKNTLEVLYKTYLTYPEAVSTLHAHLILFDKDNNILPYQRWIHETDVRIHEPSMQLFASGNAGVLYPPKLFNPVFFNEEVIMQTCLCADELWLKAMQAISGVPVVAVDRTKILGYLPDSNNPALCQSNVDQNQNDVQLSKICEWLDRTFEPGILRKKLTQVDIGIQILRTDDVISYLDTERKQSKVELRDEKKCGEQRRQQLLERQKALDSQKEWITHLLEDRDILKDRVLKKDQILEKQKRAEAQYRLENRQLLSQVRALEEARQQPKVLLDLLMQSWKGQPISALAWLPFQYLVFLQCIQDHGFLYTIRHGFTKLGRRAFGKKQKP